jgi:hypothetical protein
MFQRLHRTPPSRARSFALLEPLEGRILLDGAVAAAVTAAATTPPRIMENLGRGVTVVRATSTQAFVSWRLLALDPAGISFNVYRSANGGAFQKLNAAPLTAGTNYTDGTVNFAVANVYHVRAVINGVEQAPSGAFTLKANTADEPVIRVPLSNPLPNYYTKFVWVGDLDGDGEFDFVIDRLSPTDPANNDIGLGNQYLEAYTRAGVKLWTIDMGLTSRNTYNIEPGAATISVGNWDGVTVADMDGDGKAEVLLKTANGVVFGDGQTLTASSNSLQYISVINGMTGAERARMLFANDYLGDGAMGMMFGAGSVDGVHTALYVKAKNRVGNGGFNETVQTYAFNGTSLTRLWKWNRGGTNAPDGHQFRIIDVDGDGKDEYCEIGFTLNSNGTLRYSLGVTGGVVHGDRFHIGDFDPDRPGLEGYGIQQDNPSLLYDFYYDAGTGQMLWQHFSTSIVDVGRGVAADIDPRYRGFETWAFNGTWNAPANTQTSTTTPYPQLSMQWDGDLLWETRNDGKIENWNYQTSTVSRLLTEWQFDSVESGSLPMFYGDIFGDWREEVVTLNTAENALTIFTTDIPTNYRLYTLAQNPAYRNCMTLKGYYQSNQLDYYLGDGMATPPTPNILYAGTQPPTQTQVLQAEAASLTGGVTIDSNHAGFNGAGFANFPGNAGVAQWSNVDGGAGGFTTLRIRYALGNTTARTGVLKINGTAQPVTFEYTGAWTTWQYLSVIVPLTAGKSNTIRLESTGQDLGNVDELQVDVILPAEVVGRRLFYNNSVFDGGNPAANAGDDNAIATDKVPLLPGGTAAFENYSSYYRGINGIMIDIQRPAGAIGISDFLFAAGNDNNPDAWPAAGPPASITTRAGAGADGSTRVTLIWGDFAIQNKWLRITLKGGAGSNSGLLADDQFYFGSNVAEAGDTPGDAKVNATDEIVTRFAAAPAVPVTNRADFNRDGKVDGADVGIVRGNNTWFQNQLKLIQVPGAAAALGIVPAAAPVAVRTSLVAMPTGGVTAPAASMPLVVPADERPVAVFPALTRLRLKGGLVRNLPVAFLRVPHLVPGSAKLP